MKTRSSTLTSSDVLRVIEEARDAELYCNLDLSRQILSTFWEDIEVEPDVTSFVFPAQAELLRLCGVFLNQFGRARGLADYQIRAKDILTRAARLFDEGNVPDKAAETKVALANCYLFAGEITEYDAILKTIKAEFESTPDHPVSIQIDLNQLLAAMLQRNFGEAERFIKKIATVISREHDFRLRTHFHNLTCIVYQLKGDVDQSVWHAKEAVNIASAANNSMFVALNLNNLANTYRTGGDLERALATSNAAIAITESRGDKGWTAHFLDTKALTYLDQGEHDKALDVIERSIDIFSEGEDFSGWTDAMWTKCLCLLRLDQPLEAVELFAKLMDLADRQIGKVAVDKFAALFVGEMHPLRRFPLTDELTALKRSLVVKALRETEGHMAKAVKVLGLRSQQHLSQILNREFPDIYDELGIKRRARRAKEIKKEPPLWLSRLIMPKGRTYSFNFNWRGTLEPQFFYFPKYLMLAFGIKADAIVAVMPVKSESLFDGGIVLYSYNYTFRIGRLAYDELAQIFLVDLEELIFLSDVTLIGVPIGYCRVADRHKKTMKFERLEFITED